MITAQSIIDHLHMKPLPDEGGYYKETCRTPLHSAIYYLLTPETFSAIHRLPGDEVYHFYLGDPMEMLLLQSDGSGRTVTLGNMSFPMTQLQLLVPGKTWQGSRLLPGGQFALLGTTMAPPFEFEHFELGKRQELLSQYPDFAGLITELTKDR